MGLCGYPHGFLPFLVLQILLFLALLREKFGRAFPHELVGGVIRGSPAASAPDSQATAATEPGTGGVTTVTLRRFHSAGDGPCCVCLEEFEGEEEVRELPSCRHFFHRGCLERWVGDHTHRTCPLCRSLL